MCSREALWPKVYSRVVNEEWLTPLISRKTQGLLTKFLYLPLARTTLKALGMTETTSAAALTRGLFMHTLRRRKRWHYAAARPIHNGVHMHKHTCGKTWQDSDQHPPNNIPQPPITKKNLMGGGGRKKSLVPAYNFFFRGYPRRGEGGVQKRIAQNFFAGPKPEISSTLPHLFGFGRCKEDSFQGNH